MCGEARKKDGSKLLRCTACKAVRYCSEECQRTHWREGGHRQECKRLAAAAAAKQ